MTNDLKPEDLKPCPFCGNDQILVMEDDEFKGSWNIWCHGDFMHPKDTHCGAYLENFNSKENAIKAWNHRTPTESNSDDK